MPKPTTLVTPGADGQVESFRKARRDRRSELIDDYVELISDLMEEGGEARQIDIAQRLGVAQPTVAKMLKRLANEGYVTQRPYRGIFLTDMGRELAERARHRHHVVERLLIAIGVGEDDARHDSEGIEHHVSDATLDVFERFLREHHADRRL